MTLIAWAFLPLEVFAVLAEAAFTVALAIVCARAAWRWLRYRTARARFRHGGIPGGEKCPWTIEDENTWQRTLKHYRRRGREPRYAGRAEDL